MRVALSWTAASGATGYNVKRSTTNRGAYTTLTNVAGTTYTDTGLTNGTTYYYVISSTNTCGESANSAQVSATPASTVTVPAAPTGLAASPGPGAKKAVLEGRHWCYELHGHAEHQRRRRFVRADRNH